MDSDRPLVCLTGASRGVGKAVAHGLARRGCDLAIVGRPSPRLDAVVAELAPRCRVDVVSVDLDDPAAVEAAGHQVLALGRPVALVNNAATIERAVMEELPVASFRRQVDVNLVAPFVLARTLLPAFREARHGRIVNVSSIAGTLGTARCTAYCASKWGLIGLTKAMAEELVDSGVTACVVLPGSIDTDMLVGSGFTPRMTADDVAATLVHYALDAPAAHNGATIEMFGT